MHDSHDVIGTGVSYTASVVYAHPEHGCTQHDTIRTRDPTASCAWNTCLNFA